MPDRTKLRIGDRIRLLRMPESDLRQRQREVADGVEEAGCAADALERVLREGPVLTITEIDAYGHPWFAWVPREPEMPGEVHTFTLIDDDSWAYA